MHFAKWLIAASLALVLTPAGMTPAHAGSKEGVTMSDTVTVAGKTLVLNGMGLREKAFFDVYVAGLYLEAKSKDANAILEGKMIKRIHLVFKRDVDRGQMVEALNEAFDKNAGDKKAELKPHMKTFSGYLAALPEGSSMTLTHVPGQGLTVHINGKEKGTVANDDFARVIFAGWLGSKAGDGDLKRGLLGR